MFKSLLHGCVTLIGAGLVQNEERRESVMFVILVENPLLPLLILKINFYFASRYTYIAWSYFISVFYMSGLLNKILFALA